MEINPYTSPQVHTPVEQPSWTWRRVLILVGGGLFVLPLAAYVGAMIVTGIAVLLFAPRFYPGAAEPPPDSLADISVGSGVVLGAAVGALSLLWLSRKYR